MLYFCCIFIGFLVGIIFTIWASHQNTIYGHYKIKHIDGDNYSVNMEITPNQDLIKSRKIILQKDELSRV